MNTVNKGDVLTLNKKGANYFNFVMSYKRACLRVKAGDKVIAVESGEMPCCVPEFAYLSDMTALKCGEFGSYLPSYAYSPEEIGFLTKASAGFIAFFDWLGQQDESLTQCYEKRLKLWGVK